MKPLLDFLSGKTITLLASAARTVTAGTNGDVARLPSNWKRCMVLLDITASAHETADYLDVYVDVSLDNSKWLNAVHFTQHAGDGGAVSQYAILDPSAPGTAVITTTSDAASGVVRPSAWGLFIRPRWVVTEASADADASHTFSMVLLGQP